MENESTIELAIEQGVVDVEDVVRKLGLNIERGPTSTGELQLFCLSNKEQAPSLFVNNKTGKFTCYSCKRFGSLVTLAANVLSDGTETASQPDYDAAKDLIYGGRDLTGLKLNAIRALIQSKPEEKSGVGIKGSKKLFSDTCSTDVYSSTLLRYWVEEHGVTVETLKHFGVKDVFNGYYRFRSIVPVRTGKRQAFEARMHLKEEEWEKVNPWRFGNEGYAKALYPKGWNKELYVWKTGDTEGRKVVLVEGIPSAMRFHQLGYVGVAVFGSTPTVRQLFKAVDAKTIYLGYDRDKPGRDATEATKEVLLGVHGDVRKLKLTRKDTDPCNYTDDGLVDILSKSVRLGDKYREVVRQLKPRGSNGKSKNKKRRKSKDRKVRQGGS